MPNSNAACPELRRAADVLQPIADPLPPRRRLVLEPIGRKWRILVEAAEPRVLETVDGNRVGGQRDLAKAGHWLGQTVVEFLDRCVDHQQLDFERGIELGWLAVEPVYIGAIEHCEG